MLHQPIQQSVAHPATDLIKTHCSGLLITVCSLHVADSVTGVDSENKVRKEKRERKERKKNDLIVRTL